MALRISSKLHRELLDLAAASLGTEVCGLIVGEREIDAVVPATNVAVDPACSFEIDPVVLFAAIRADRAGRTRLMGYYHSHPFGPPTPSRRDTALAMSDGKVWLIIGDGRVAAWRMDQSRHFDEIELTITD